MAQSSVEWLIKQAENLMPPDVPNAWVKIKEQAKAMHEKEIRMAHCDGFPFTPYDNKTAKEYYIQTFGNETE